MPVAISAVSRSPDLQNTASANAQDSYRIQLGDTLSDIAARFGTDVDTLARMNGISNPNRIYAGQTISVPTGGSTYIVRRGDTLSQIAMQNNSSVDALMRANPHIRNADQIYPGETIRIAGSGAAESSGATQTGASPVQASAGRVAQTNASASTTPSTGQLSDAGLRALYQREAQAGVSNRLHWPGGSSGVTLGPGYDMGGKSRSQVISDLTAIGVDRATAARIAEGAGLTGQAAGAFARNNRNLVNLNQSQEMTLLRNTVRPFTEFVAGQIRVPVSQNQFDAMVSFAYNIGRNGFAGSTALARLNSGNIAGVPEAMSWWNKSGGRVNQGLINRRNAEIAQFRSGGSPTISPATAQPAATGANRANAAQLGQTSGLSGQRYADIIAQNGDRQAQADLAAGRPVVVALRNPTNTRANGGNGVYDDTIAVVQRQRDGSYTVREFRGNTDPSAQYAYNGRKPMGRDVNGDGRVDQGRLQAGSYRFRPDGQFLGNQSFRATRTQIVERDTNQDGIFDSRDGNRIDRSGAGTSMLIHQGGGNNTWSAGCQTMAPGDFNQFVNLVGGQREFSYVLVNAR